VGLGPENQNLEGLKTPNFAVRCPIEAKQVANGSSSFLDISFSSEIMFTARLSLQIRRPVSSRPSFSQLKF
jgi:hypothetical protein